MTQLIECSQCGQQKPQTAFYRNGKHPDGTTRYRRYCKACGTARYGISPEANRAKTAAWRTANPERALQAGRDWYLKAATKAYAAANAEALAAARKAKYEADIEANRAANRERYRTHRAGTEKWRLGARRAAAAYRARKAAAPTIPHTQEQWEQKVEMWADACWICGDEWEAIDHVKPIVAGGSHILANLRPICNTCNRRKGGCWPFPTIQSLAQRVLQKRCGATK